MSDVVDRRLYCAQPIAGAHCGLTPGHPGSCAPRVEPRRVRPVSARPSVPPDAGRDVGAEVDEHLDVVNAELTEVLERRWEHVCPARFVEARLDDVDQPEAMPELLAWLARARTGAGDNLVLSGPVGTGKTFAAVALGRDLHFHGGAVAVMPVVELLDALRPDGGAQLGTYTEPYVLVLDDLGAEKPTEWTAERLYAVVNRRWLERRPTIVTTDVTLEGLARAVGRRTFDRLRDGAVAIEFAGGSRRRGRGDG